SRILYLVIVVDSRIKINYMLILAVGIDRPEIKVAKVTTPYSVPIPILRAIDHSFAVISHAII
ncbi:23844_t:CDS:1, partial [Dentiscutata erythropus]